MLLLLLLLPVALLLCLLLLPVVPLLLPPLLLLLCYRRLRRMRVPLWLLCKLHQLPLPRRWKHKLFLKVLAYQH